MLTRRFSSQNDPIFPDIVRTSGDRAMCVATIPQVFLGRAIAPEHIISVFREFQDTPAVLDWKTFNLGVDECLIADRLFHMLGAANRLSLIGQIDAEGHARVWNGRKTKDYQFVIGHWQTDEQFGHYTLFDANGVELYDPWDPAFAGREINKKRVIRKLVYRVV